MVDSCRCHNATIPFEVLFLPNRFFRQKMGEEIDFEEFLKKSQYFFSPREILADNSLKHLKIESSQ
ncbi:Protein CBG27392 [Caenorhabditis briggsae]|uniref:Protein CBG27392 n=1 Tax=Caenorhabditis briggsae TaxID=6238 RepID=B6IH08_CAEBR|nr:Protein CBG27392 [Caenorhabditis briggsae]CAR99188.1 Protein CBG27392 [Caenorhabditis briggsae]